jgi:hypothetical protein
MQIALCKKSIDRLGPGAAPLLDALRERGHEPAQRDCLQRCQACDLGLLIAVAGGMPVSAKTSEKLLATVDELAADD